MFFLGSQLSEEERKMALIYIMDRYKVLLEAYHEISQLSKDLPRTYTLESSQRKLNDNFSITSTSGKEMSAYTPFIQELRKDRRLSK